MDTTQIWQSLEHLVKNPSDLNTLFESDFDRGDRFGVSACDIYMDFSKQMIDDEVLGELLKLADTAIQGSAKGATAPWQ